MFFGTALFLSFVKGRSLNGESDVQGDGRSEGTQQQHDQLKNTQATALTTVMVDSQTDLDQAKDEALALIEHLVSNGGTALDALVLVRAFSLENVNLYIIGLRE